jgi:hypothetical protein
MKLSLLIRRAHMYLALFLTPWVLMYALSTAAMNHRTFFHPPGSPAQTFDTEQTTSYSRTFPAEAKPADKARQILTDLNLEGAHSVNSSAGGQRLTILRQDPVAPRRLIFTPADGKLVIEKQRFAMPSFLERMHRRRGYQHDYAAEDAWAASVDLVIVAILFWSLSGVWMCWEMKRTRRWGAVCGLAGCGLFAFFLAMI